MGVAHELVAVPRCVPTVCPAAPNEAFKRLAQDLEHEEEEMDLGPEERVQILGPIFPGPPTVTSFDSD